jgi:putative transposase
MVMRKEPLVTGEYYHIYNRGVDKRDIFNDTDDLERFKESIKQFNQVEEIGSLELYHKSVSALGPHLDKKSKPLVAIVAFCVNPNHFHFVLKQLVDSGISKFMQKTLAGYTSYFNQKNERSGSLFQGTFKSKLIQDEDYFRKIFGYVKQNYAVHNILKEKLKFIFASDLEYDKEIFDFVDKNEGKEILKVFEGKANFKKHCSEIIDIIREERGKPSLNEPDELP